MFTCPPGWLWHWGTRWLLQCFANEAQHTILETSQTVLQHTVSNDGNAIYWVVDKMMCPWDNTVSRSVIGPVRSQSAGQPIGGRPPHPLCWYRLPHCLQSVFTLNWLCERNTTDQRQLGLWCSLTFLSFLVFRLKQTMNHKTTCTFTLAAKVAH